jgi:hypothetical protein
MISESIDEIGNIGMLRGKHEEMLETLDGFDTDGFNRKVVNKIQDQGSRSRRLWISGPSTRMTVKLGVICKTRRGDANGRGTAALVQNDAATSYKSQPKSPTFSE